VGARKLTVKLSGANIKDLYTGSLAARWISRGRSTSGQNGFPSTPILDERRRSIPGPGGFSGGVGGKADQPPARRGNLSLSPATALGAVPCQTPLTAVAPPASAGAAPSAATSSWFLSLAALAAAGELLWQLRLHAVRREWRGRRRSDSYGQLCQHDSRLRNVDRPGWPSLSLP